jgi:hypothetical protein
MILAFFTLFCVCLGNHDTGDGAPKLDVYQSFYPLYLNLFAIYPRPDLFSDGEIP